MILWERLAQNVEVKNIIGQSYSAGVLVRQILAMIQGGNNVDVILSPWEVC